MYCVSCGQDQPEIKINNKLYCSNCGQPLDASAPATISTHNQPEEKQEDKNELSTAFGAMKSAIDTSGGAGFYRSGDARILPRGGGRPQEASVGPAAVAVTPTLEAYDAEKPVQKSIEEELNIGANASSQESPVPVQIAVPQADDNRISDQKDDSHAEEDKELEKNLLAAFGKDKVETENETEPTIELPKVQEVEPEKESKEEPKEKKYHPIQKFPPSKLAYSAKAEEPKKEEKVQEEVDADEKIEGDSEVLSSAKKALTELYREESQKDITPRIKEVDKLGASSRLIDILEDKAEDKAIDDKKKEVKKMGAVTRLIDILNQPVKSPEPVKKHDKNPIIKETEKLDEELELPSPLDEPEIPSPLDTEEIAPLEPVNEIANPEGSIIEEAEGDESTDWPIFKENAKEPEGADKDEKYNNFFEANSEESEKPVAEEKVEEEEQPQKEIEEILNVEPEKKPADEKVEKAETEDEKVNEAPQETVSSPLNFSGEAIHTADTNEEIAEPAELPDHEIDSIKKEIHGLGDKKGHVEDWPEEDVVKHAEDKKPDNPLKDYFNDLLTHKETSEKPKEKPKTDKEKSNLLKFLEVFGLSIVIIGLVIAGAVYYTNYSSGAKITTPKVSFTTSYPSYLPPGFKQSELKDENNIVYSIYSYLPDSSQKITLTEQALAKDFNISDFASKNSVTYSITQKDGQDYYLLDDKKISLIKNDLLITVEKTDQLNIEKLKKVAESIK